MDGFARVQVADADLVADARREFVVVEEGVHLLDLRAAERLHAQPHALRRDRPGAAANERRTDAPAEAAALERADGVERGGGRWGGFGDDGRWGTRPPPRPHRMGAVTGSFPPSPLFASAAFSAALGLVDMVSMNRTAPSSAWSNAGARMRPRRRPSLLGGTAARAHSQMGSSVRSAKQRKSSASVRERDRRHPRTAPALPPNTGRRRQSTSLSARARSHARAAMELHVVAGFPASTPYTTNAVSLDRTHKNATHPSHLPVFFFAPSLHPPYRLKRSLIKSVSHRPLDRRRHF